jgi:hypothetical protein
MPKANRTCIRIFKEIEDLLEGENKMGKKRKELAGKVFGKLTAVEVYGTDKKSRKTIWKCICSCGKMTNVRTDHLTAKKIISCGACDVAPIEMGAMGATEEPEESQEVTERKKIPTVAELRESFERMKEKRTLILHGVKIKPDPGLIKRFERIRKMSEEKEKMEQEKMDKENEDL